MNIIIINRSYAPDEADTNRIIAYANAFAKLGHMVTMLYLIPNRSGQPYMVPVQNCNVINIWEKDGWLARKNRVISLIFNTFKLLKYISKDDVVYIYGCEYYFLKSSLAITPNVYCETTEIPFYGKESTKFGRWMHRKQVKLIKRTKGLFVISQSLKAYYLKEGIEQHKVYISNMFVNRDRFDGIQKDCLEKYVGYCGVIGHHKDGVDDLLHAFSIFHKTHPEYKLKLAGRGETPIVLEEMKEMSHKLRVGDSVEFLGQIPSDQMPRFLMNASILALARTNNLQSQNGFPTKLGEYLSTGNPVAITRVGEIPLFIKDGVNGFLATPDDPEDFAKVLTHIADNYDEAKRVGLKGKELTKKEFSSIEQAKVLIDIMEKSREK